MKWVVGPCCASCAGATSAVGRRGSAKGEADSKIGLGGRLRCAPIGRRCEPHSPRVTPPSGRAGAWCSTRHTKVHLRQPPQAEASESQHVLDQPLGASDSHLIRRTARRPRQLLGHATRRGIRQQCVKILSNIAKGLPSAGRVLVVEMVIPDDRTPTAAQLVDVNMLALLPGRERTQSEYANLFQAAGLQLKSVTQTHSPFQIVEATAASYPVAPSVCSRSPAPSCRQSTERARPNSAP